MLAERMERLGRELEENAWARGMKAGLQEGRREMILDLLVDQFGSVPQSICEKISGISDIDRLKMIASQGLSASSLEDFERFLDQL